jgi:hypothetical protein
MGLFSNEWHKKDTKKALAAVSLLKSDGALLRAAKGAHDEMVAFFAVSRIKDELLLEQLALGESRISAHVAAAALLRIADNHQEFPVILQRLEYEASLGEPRVTALLNAAMDLTADPALFAKFLKALEPKERNEYLKRCVKDDNYMSMVLLHCVGLFSCTAQEMDALIWRFSDTTILKTLETIDDIGITLSESAGVLVQRLTAPESVLEAVRTAKAIKARQMALERITDQSTLLEIALHNGSSVIRQEAADRLIVQADIIQFITMNPDDVSEDLLSKALRPATAEKKGSEKKPANTTSASLSKEQLLDVAIKSRYHKARQKAVSLITDPSDLNLYARRHMRELDEKTVLRLTSQPLLAELACDRYRYQQPIRLAAVSRLTVDERLGQVVWERTQFRQSEDDKQLVEAALSRIHNQDIIYQAMGLADGLDTYIGVEALNYISDTSILLKVAVGRNRFSKAAAERVEEEAALKEIIREAKPTGDVYYVAYKKLEAMRIAALEQADGDALKEAVLHDESISVRVAAIKRITDQDFLKTYVLADEDDESFLVSAAAIERIEDQDFIEKIALDDKKLSLHAAAAWRLKRWEVLLDMVSRNSVSIILARKLLCSDAFAGKRDEIVAAAALNLRKGDEEAALRFAAIIAGLTGEDEKDVCIRYGGIEFMQMQIDYLLHRTELEKFKETLAFLRYAYGRSEHYREKLEGIGGRNVSLHHDFNSSCASKSCDVMVEETIEFE